MGWDDAQMRREEAEKIVRYSARVVEWIVEGGKDWEEDRLGSLGKRWDRLAGHDDDGVEWYGQVRESSCQSKGVLNVRHNHVTVR